MPLAPAVIAAIIGAAGSAAGGALSSTATRTSTPTIDPAYKGLQGLVLNQVQQRLNTPIDTSGYEASGIANINHASDLARGTVENTLAARGLSRSPVAGNAAAVAETGRAGEVAGFQNSIPLLVRQMQGQDLNAANSVLAQGRGVTTTDTSGGGAAGAFTNLASYLGYLQGKGAFTSPGVSNGLPGQMSMPGAFGTSGAY